MAKDNGVVPSSSAWGRVSAVVKRVEGMPLPQTGRANRNTSPQVETVLARLESKVGDQWAWVEVYRDSDGSFSAVPDGRRGAEDETPMSLAFPLVDDPDPDYDSGSIVAMRRSATKSGDTWEPGWAILTPPPPPPAPPLGLYRVELSTDGGTSDADPDATATYTYAITDRKNLDGSDPDAAQSPEVPRELGYRDAATLGTAYYDDEGKLTLFQAFEPAGTGPCDTDEESGGE